MNLRNNSTLPSKTTQSSKRDNSYFGIGLFRISIISIITCIIVFIAWWIFAGTYMFFNFNSLSLLISFLIFSLMSLASCYVLNDKQKKHTIFLLFYYLFFFASLSISIIVFAQEFAFELNAPYEDEYNDLNFVWFIVWSTIQLMLTLIVFMYFYKTRKPLRDKKRY